LDPQPLKIKARLVGSPIQADAVGRAKPFLMNLRLRWSGGSEAVSPFTLRRRLHRLTVGAETVTVPQP
jgi:hypothetical protein